MDWRMEQRQNLFERKVAISSNDPSLIRDRNAKESISFGVLPLPRLEEAARMDSALRIACGAKLGTNGGELGGCTHTDVHAILSVTIPFIHSL